MLAWSVWLTAVLHCLVADNRVALNNNLKMTQTSKNKKKSKYKVKLIIIYL